MHLGTLPEGVTTTPAQSAALATVSPYALPNCGWGQKTVGNGPFTCQFDIGTALQQAAVTPGTYLSKIIPAIGRSETSLYLASAAAYAAIAYFLFAKRGKR